MSVSDHQKGQGSCPAIRICPTGNEMLSLDAEIILIFHEGFSTLFAVQLPELGFTGRGEGLAAQAVALLRRE